ncbi:hypothetical protein [Microlunatus sp. GCM10028923]|uniref:hypothetical protein n=1 Tax=Microlunatus sp. GCM10028923 TaxID=3273400 RepID=UPI003609D7C3
MDRRTLLTHGGRLAVASAVAPLAAGCATGAGERDTGQRNAGVALPEHVRFDAVKPDLPAQHPNAVDGFLSYPRPAHDAVTEPPGDGSEVTGFTVTSISAAPPMHSNRWWQNVNQQLGSTLKLEYVADANYQQKFQTMIAGGGLPDLVRIPSVPRLDQLLPATFADLTEYVAGDAIKDYPMLANLPTDAWRSCVYAGGIYGVPVPLLPIGTRLEARLDVIERLGQSIELESGAAFLELCRAVTDPKQNRWAMVQPTANFIKLMFGLPNVWQVEDGTFRHEVESEAYPDWLDFVAKMWSEGLFHPDSFGQPQFVPLFSGERFMLFQVGGMGFTRAYSTYRAGAPDLAVSPVIPPRFEGGGPAPVQLGQPKSAMIAIRKDAPPDRIRMLLRVLNCLGASFGTQQWLDAQYGLEGVDWTWDDTIKGPKPTKLGTVEQWPVTQFPGYPNIMYTPEGPQVTRAECAYENAVGPDALPLETIGLYSSTDSAKGPTLTTMINSEVGDIIQGRKPVSGWSEVVDRWRAEGGDDIRREYEEARAAAR